MSSTYFAYVWLGGAIAFEVLATAFLQKSEQFTRLLPTLAMATFYTASIYLLSLSLKTLPLGVAYAIWGGLGTLLTAVVGLVVYRQMLDVPGVLGIGLIVSGVVVVNVFSKSIGH